MSINEKTLEKSKRLIKADLNFISQKPLEIIVQEIQTLAPKAVNAQVEWTEVDTALFQLTYTRDGRTTAEVSGRLQRWAGDMTHIYCDGRTFRSKMSYLMSLFRWIVIAIFAAPAFICPLAVLSMSNFTIVLFWYSLVASMFVAFIAGIIAFIRNIWIASDKSEQPLSKPEKKDRERLLQFLTEIIRDENYASQSIDEGETLSDEEAAAFLERASLMARLKKL